MTNEDHTATRWPLNFTHAKVTIHGVTPEGVEIEFVAHRVKFADPDDMVLIEVQHTSEDNRSGPQFMLDMRGTLTTTNVAEAIYEVSVAQPEDGQRLLGLSDPKPDLDWPSGWTDPGDWA